MAFWDEDHMFAVWHVAMVHMICHTRMPKQYNIAIAIEPVNRLSQAHTSSTSPAAKAIHQVPHIQHLAAWIDVSS